jgi:hypothetical protein
MSNHELGGLRLAAAIRDRWPPVNIIVTTGKKRPEKHQMPTNSVFIAKPYFSHSSSAA